MITRILGFLFRIYLSRELGAELMGVYQVALSVFMVLLTLTASGVPFVVSRKTAGYIALGLKKEERNYLTIGLMLSLGLSVALCALIMIFQNQIAPFFTNPQSLSILLMLLPAVVFNAVCAAFRGNLWGHKRWIAVSSVELIEQIARIVLCFLLMKNALNSKAEIAALSLSAACLISCVVCAIMYFYYGGSLGAKKGIAALLFRESASITGIRVCSTLINFSVALLLPLMLIKSGLTSSQAMSEYGAAMGMAFPILYLPSTIIGALAFALVPELAKNQSENNKEALSYGIESSVVFSIGIGALFVPLFAGLGSEVGSFIYNNQSAGEFLRFSSWILIPIALEQITSSVMNSINLELRGFLNYLLGTVLLMLSILFLTKYIGIHSLSVGYGASLLFSSVLDIVAVRKKVALRAGIIKQLALSAVFCVPSSLLTLWLNNVLILRAPQLLSMLISGSAGMMFMLILLVMFKILDIDKYISKKPRGQAKNKPALKQYLFF